MHNHCTQCVSRALAAGSLLPILLLLSCTTTSWFSTIIITQEYNNDAEKVISGITMSHDDDEDIETGQCVCEGGILWVCVLCEGGGYCGCVYCVRVGYCGSVYYVRVGYCGVCIV